MNQDASRSAKADRIAAASLGAEDTFETGRFGRDQSFIARFMMWVFGLSVGTTILTISVAPLMTPDWKTLIPLLLEVIKVAVVPMATLVLGYYFAKSGK